MTSYLDILVRGLGIVALGVAPIAIAFILFGTLERFFPAQALKSAQGWLFNIKLALMYLAVPTFFGGLIAGLIATVLALNGGGILNLSIGADVSPPLKLASIPIFLLVFDFFYYWWHRAQHEVPMLWAFHKLHHMDESLGVSTQMRCHWLEEIGRIPFIFVPMALLFNLPLHTGIVALVLTAWGAFIHANLRLSLGKASILIAGPQVHRIHHSRLAHHFDKNYAAFFPFYDALFRTYYHPAPDEYPPTGVNDDPEINSVIQAFLLPFQSRAQGRAHANRQAVRK